jgi:beta-phosphoglucomutase family hydrolase
MPYPKALIFDMDGTLVDNMEYHKQSWIELFKFHQLDLDYTTFDNQYHKGSLVEIMARLFPHIEDNKELFRIGSYKEELYRELYRPHVKAIDGLHPFLNLQKEKKIPMGIATMGDQHNIDFIFKALKLETYFHSTTGGHQVTNGKPHPEIFLTAAQKLEVAPEDCLVFEDTRSGITAARAAGMQVIGLTTMFDQKTLLELGCVQAVDDFIEIDII